MLEPAQDAVLAALVAVAQRAGPEGRDPFVVMAQLGKRTLDVIHPAVTDSPIDTYLGDLAILEDEGYIRVLSRRGAVPEEFVLTPRASQRDATRTAVGPLAAGAPAAVARRWDQWVAIGERPLARSAMSVVWRVRHDADPAGTVRVLKELKYENKGRGSAAYRRFVREIEILASDLRGRHPGIIEVIAHALPADGDARRPYYVMPMAEGSLAAARVLRGNLEPVFRIGLALADALGAAHDAGVIHRDVKPANVLFFGDDHAPVLCDFGISFLIEEDRLTRAEAQTVGTDEFVAPELLGGGQSVQVTPSVDVYSLGKTLFAVVSGGDVFPRERLDDPRFDLATRFGDTRFAHFRGLLELMVTESPSARLQSMAEVRAVLERAIANLQAGVAYAPGMYGSTHSAAERFARTTRTLDGPPARQRTDAVRADVAAAASAAENCANDYAHARGTRGFYLERVDDEAAAAAASCAEELMAVGLPLVSADERDEFEEWLAGATGAPPPGAGYERPLQRGLLRAAGVLAAYAAGALAWRQRRLALLRMVVERYVGAGSAWVHHDILGRNATALHPWVTRALKASTVVARADAPFAAAPEAAVSFVGGMAALMYLRDAEPSRMNAFLRAPSAPDFPVTFAPGLVDLVWTTELLNVGAAKGPRERELAAGLFDLNPPDFRAMCARLTTPLRVTASQASARIGRFDEMEYHVDMRRWREWCGGE